MPENRGAVGDVAGASAGRAWHLARALAARLVDGRAARVIQTYAEALRWRWLWSERRRRFRAWLCRCLHGGCAPVEVDAEPVSTFWACRRCGRWWR